MGVWVFAVGGLLHVCVFGSSSTPGTIVSHSGERLKKFKQGMGSYYMYYGILRERTRTFVADRHRSGWPQDDGR